MFKVHADAEATRKMIKSMERSSKLAGIVSVLFAAAFIYIITNAIEEYRIFAGFCCLLATFLAWISHVSVPGYRKELNELPLLYSFYPDGFISHRSEQRLTWSQVHKIQYEKSGIHLDMRNAKGVAKMSFICISESSVESILQHMKTYAPERLARKIKL